MNPPKAVVPRDRLCRSSIVTGPLRYRLKKQLLRYLLTVTLLDPSPLLERQLAKRPRPVWQVLLGSSQGVALS